MFNEEHFRRYICENPSTLGLKIAALIDEEVGLHNIQNDIRDKVDWSCDYMIAIPWPRWFPLATYDGDRLTRLVVKTHDLMLRMEIVPRHRNYTELRFWQRAERTGKLCRRIPTIEEHIVFVRENRI